MRNGRFWSLIGVGRYSFSPWKAAWESMGRRDYRAIVLEGRWQGNQAMHAYLPCFREDEARRLRDELNSRIPAYLKLFGMEGTCNRAQPGRVGRVLRDSAEQGDLFPG